jgi:predicted phage terminase large subunit-like protein
MKGGENMLNVDLGRIPITELSRTDQKQMLQALTPKKTEYIVHQPYPKQAAFMLLDIKEAFYGGAAGGGKSDALLMCALQYVDTPGYTAIIFRKTFADLVKPGALIDRAQTWLAPWTNHPDPKQRVRWSDKEKKFTFPSGAILQFGYMETAKDRFNYQGGEYQFIGFDEVTHMLEICYTYMFSRLRRLKTAKHIPLRVRAASNPPDDGDNAEWVYDRFVNPKTKDPARIFIPAGMDDNPHLDAESYQEALEELDPVTRARLRDGLWEIKRQGNMFKRDWFEYVDAPPQGRRAVRFWDCAATEVDPAKKRAGKKADWTVGLKMSEKGGIYYIEDIIHIQQSAMNVEKTQKETAVSDGYNVKIFEEEEGGSSGKYAIDKKKKEIFKHFSYAGVKNTGSKIDRAKAVSAAAERGVIKIVRGCRNLEEFFNEIEGFPSAPHDDLVDGFSGAFNALGALPVYGVPTDVAAGPEGSYWRDAGEKGVDSRYEAIFGSSYWNGV